MAVLPQSTIEQWGVLRAVVNHGGFAQAAEALNRSQSSVSYAVARLQDTLGVQLLEPQGRRSVLTPAGTALLAEAIPLIDELQRIEARTLAIATGEDVSINLVVDSLFPRARLFAALETFAHYHPHVEIHLREAVRQRMQQTQDDGFDIAILMPEAGAPMTRLVADIPLVAVAHPDHPLIVAEAPPGQTQLARHVRVEIRGIEPIEGGAHTTGKIWRMNTIETAIDSVRRGLCYGWLPLHLIEDDLTRGSLCPLNLRSGKERHIPLGLLLGGDDIAHAPSVIMLAKLLGGDDDAVPGQALA